MTRWGMTLPGVVLALAGCHTTSPATTEAASSIGIDHMVIPAAGEAGGPVAAYAGFDNRGGEDRLLAVECDCAESVELHKVVRDGGNTSMTNTFPLLLPANARIEVKPPGIPMHFMLIGTRRAFKVGERVPMRLRFERAGIVEAVFTVAPDSASGWANWVAP